MEKMIVTEYGRPIMLNKVKEFAQRTMYLAEDKKAVFDVNLEVFGIRNFLEMLRYVSADSDSVYRIMINELKQQLKSGELDVSFS